MLAACRHLLTCTDALETELCALSEGITLSMQWSNLTLQVETDCLEAICMVTSEKQDRSRFVFLVQEIKQKLLERKTHITHVRHSQNKVSHFWQILVDYIVVPPYG